MTNKPNELELPPTATAGASEVLRLWATADGQLEFVIAAAWEDTGLWGLALVDLARHVARAYADQGKGTFETNISRIQELWDDEHAEPTAKGQLQKRLPESMTREEAMDIAVPSILQTALHYTARTHPADGKEASATVMLFLQIALMHHALRRYVEGDLPKTEIEEAIRRDITDPLMETIKKAFVAGGTPL